MIDLWHIIWPSGGIQQSVPCDVTFPNKLYGESNKIDDPISFPMIYKGLDDEENDESIFIHNWSNNYDCNVVINDSESESEDENFLVKSMKTILSNIPKKKLKWPQRPLLNQLVKAGKNPYFIQWTCQ